MDCIGCKKITRAKGSLRFPELKSASFPVCADCGKAGRPQQFLKPSASEDRQMIDFARRLEAKAISETQACKLRVLVWGPNPKSKGDKTRFAEKRKQIKEALIAEGHEAYFSEELISRSNRIPLNLIELMQTAEIDAVINLATDFGPMGEAHEMGTKLGHKLLLWLPAAARKKYIDEGIRRIIDASGGKSVFFNDSHLESCCMTLASVDFVNDKRYRKLYLTKQREMIDEALR